MYALAQPSGSQQNAPSNYASGFTPPLMKGELPELESDSDLAALLKQSKAAWDGNKDASAEAKKEHVKAVTSAVETYASKHSTPLAKQAVAGIDGDVNLRDHR